jgi:hypothetical protein
MPNGDGPSGVWRGAGCGTGGSRDSNSSMPVLDPKPSPARLVHVAAVLTISNERLRHHRDSGGECLL